MENNLKACADLSEVVKEKIKSCCIAKEPQDIDELLDQLQKVFSDKKRPLKDLSLKRRTSDACKYLTRFFEIFKSGQEVVEINPQTAFGERTFSSGEWRALIGLGTIFSYEVVRLERDPLPGEKADRRNSLMVFKRPHKDSRADVGASSGFAAAQGDRKATNADCVDDACEFPEGNEKMVQHVERERNPELVRCAKERQRQRIGKNICEVCGFDYESVYGEIGKNFIEAHHTMPVSTLKPGESTRVSDIALVCGNCHRMLHRRRPWLSMSQLKDLIK